MLSRVGLMVTAAAAVVFGYPASSNSSATELLQQAREAEEEDWLIYNGLILGAFDGANMRTTHEYLSHLASVGALQIMSESFKVDMNANYVSKVEDYESVLQMGSKYHDMPAEKFEESGAWCATPESIASFGTRFLVNEVNTITSQSHFGCLQIWHSMAPVNQFVAKGSKSPIDYWFSNEQVRQFILTEIRRFWGQAVQLQLHYFSDPQAPMLKDSFQNGQKCALFNIGRILHMIEDSYALGHVVRAFRMLKTRSGKELIGENCGDIIMFQGYGIQDEDEHKKGDQRVNYQVTYRVCARHAARRLLVDWMRCVNEMQEISKGSKLDPDQIKQLKLCGPPEETLNRLYAFQKGAKDKLSPDADDENFVANLRAGGSRTKMVLPPKKGIPAPGTENLRQMLVSYSPNNDWDIAVSVDTTPAPLRIKYVKGPICSKKYVSTITGVVEAGIDNAASKVIDDVNTGIQLFENRLANVLKM